MNSGGISGLAQESLKNRPIYADISQFAKVCKPGLHLHTTGKARVVSLPGDAPVGLDLEDGGIVRVVELDLRVPQLSRVDIHHDRGGTWGLSRRSHTHNLLVAPPRRAGDEVGRAGEIVRDITLKCC